MIYTHWIPTHQGTFGPYNDKDILYHWESHAPASGGFLKVITVDLTIPFLEFVPPGVKLIVRNHPMSEEHGFPVLPVTPSAIVTAADVRGESNYWDFAENERYAWAQTEFEPNRLRAKTSLSLSRVWGPQGGIMPPAEIMRTRAAAFR